MTLEPTGADEILFHETIKSLNGDSNVHPEDYRDCVVLKPWGYEFQMFDDKKKSVWMLNIKPGQSTSLHCHQHKAVCLIPLVGDLTMATLSRPMVIKSGDNVSLLPKVFHRLCNMGQSDLVLMEIETPSNKFDLVRAHDSYGRAKKPYEGNNAIVRENLEQYGYGSLEEDETITRFGYDISITQAGVSYRGLINA